MSNTVDITLGGPVVRLPLDVLDRYNVHGPRYTSYPTAPEWVDEFGPDDLRRAFAEANRADPKRSVSIYFHIPFCESLWSGRGCRQGRDVAIECHLLGVGSALPQPIEGPSHGQPA